MTATAHDARPTTERLPVAKLMALFSAGFLGILNETVPAGLLPAMARDLGHSESAIGQTITVYALATAATAIPLNAVLRRLDRRALLVWALLSFAVGNAIVALTDSFLLILLARVVAGVGAGLVWSNIGGYAAELVPERLKGRAIAVTMTGIPAALSLGLPAGTLLGDLAGWRATFWVMAGAAVVVAVWLRMALPALADAPEDAHVRLGTLVRTAGVRTILVVVLGFMVAHNMLYTYVGPLSERATTGNLGWVLLVFGIAAALSIWITGLLIDPHHRELVVASTLLVAIAALVLGFSDGRPGVLYVGVATWGLGFGGSATLFLTASIRAARTNAVQSLLVTIFNVSIAAGSLAGGLLLQRLGAGDIPWVAFGLLALAAGTTFTGKRHAFPRWPRSV